MAAREQHPSVSLYQATERLAEDQARVFADWLRILNKAGIAYVVSGAFALCAYTGIWRDTKDMDIFLQPRSLKPALDVIFRAGYEVEVTDVRWLAKAFRRPYFMDLIFSLPSNLVRIDDEWFSRSRPVDILGVPARMVGPEELFASKVFVARSDRFDGADIAHLIRAVRGRLEWSRLRAMIGDDSILLWHLLLFNFIYPGHADWLPQDLMIELFDKVRTTWKTPTDPSVFFGAAIDPNRFAVDQEVWNYRNMVPHEPLVNEHGEEI